VTGVQTCALPIFLFRSASLPEAIQYFGVMLGRSSGDPSTLLLAAQLYTRQSLLIMTVGALVVFGQRTAQEWAQTITWPKALALGPALCVSLMAMFSQSFNPFLYFQF
jgi:alginate O-acetyltransferase complex protein AlgI